MEDYGLRKFNYPTTIYLGDRAIDELCRHLNQNGFKHLFLVTDCGLAESDLVWDVRKIMKSKGLQLEIFDKVHPNPTEDDVLSGTRLYKEGRFDGLIALGGGSAIDAAKAIKILSSHFEPLGRYDDTKEGWRRITNPMPELFAIPTIAGTGSEVGRSSVIIIAGRKTVLFHPRLIPQIAVLAPQLTIGLPPGLTAAAGLDAFVHCLEAYLVPSFDPMGDGIAKEGMILIVEQLPKATADGNDIKVRGKMMMAACMGATAFQKGLGMIHSMAHPLSTHYGMHHGLANALLLSPCVTFLETGAEGNPELTKKIEVIKGILQDGGLPVKKNECLSSVLKGFIESLALKDGLGAHGVKESDIENLAGEAIGDPCHITNAIPVSRNDFIEIYRRAL